MQAHGLSDSSTLHLLSSRLFEHHYEKSSRLEDLTRSYYRARAIGRQHRLTITDVLHLTPKFWDIHKDGIAVRDQPAHVLVTIQCNLVAGTLAPFALTRPDLQPLLKETLNFDISTQFMLNEIGHGCDARNLETTATWQSDGSFLLNTPRPEAAKFMPPSMPIAGIRRVSIVFAQLVVNNENRGIRPFIVPISDEREMATGVQSRLLPPIAGGRVLDHALTFFDNVPLPANAMLGDLAMPASMRGQFLSVIRRVGTGTLTMSLWIIPLLKCAAYSLGRYSQKRTVQEGVGGQRRPIISFRTQQLPVLHSLAQIAVLDAFTGWVTDRYSNDATLHPGARHGLAVIVKAIFLQNGQASLFNLVERSGAQGVFPHNQIAAFESWTRSTGIAEGEVLVLCIRLATELLLGRYTIPESTKPSCLLAQHEAGLVSELKEAQARISNHRSEEYNTHVLPHLRPMVVAIGHRMAYEAAVDAGVDPDLLALYEAGAIRSDSSWYTECLGLSRAAQFEMECKALDAVLGRLDEHLDNLDIEPYCTSPMLSPDRWQGLLDASPSYTGNAGSGLANGPELLARL